MAISNISTSNAVDGLLEGMKVVSASLGVCVHPSWSNNVRQGVREILNSLLLRFNEELDGVVLGYLDIMIPGCKAKLLPALSPYFRVDLTAKLLIFSPKMGMILEGKVIKIERDYIGVLVLGLFNAAIGFSDTRPEFHFVEQPDLRAWRSDLDKRHVIKLGTVVRFSVKSVQDGEFLDIAGCLKLSSTGSVDWLTSQFGQSPSPGKARNQMKEKHKERRREKKKSQKDANSEEVLYL